MKDLSQPVSNVFVVGSGRCGTRTFFEACKHITNWTCGHETRVKLCGYDRLDYPKQHIEVDCRLAWRTGALAQRYPDALYVHLYRDRVETAKSWAARRDGAMMRLWWRYMMLNWTRPRIPRTRQIEVAYDMVDCANANLEHALKDCRVIPVWIERPSRPFRQMWDAIAAEGNIRQAIQTFRSRYNAGLGREKERHGEV